MGIDEKERLQGTYREEKAKQKTKPEQRLTLNYGIDGWWEGEECSVELGITKTLDQSEGIKWKEAESKENGTDASEFSF